MAEQFRLDGVSESALRARLANFCANQSPLTIQTGELHSL